MTAPGGGHNEINLAALWIPVMPETSHMGEEMRKAGGDAKKQFEQGFNSSGSSPENIGQSFGSKLMASINKEMKGIELPLGTSGMFEKLNVEIDKTSAKLRGEASQALNTYRTEYEKLTDAQERATAAEKQLQIARDGGFNKASIMLPLMSEQARATQQLTEANKSATAAYDDYSTKASKASEATKDVGGSGQIMAGIMGGAVVGGIGLAIGAVDKLAEGIVEGFKKAIEVSVELADKALELGETYEHIGIQIHEFSAASGEEFEDLEKSAQRVFSTLDVAGDDVGKTMAQLSSSMGVPAESIEKLVHDVTDLQGRFTSFRTADLASALVAFKTPAEQADSALASLLHSARESGQDLGTLTQNLSGATGLVLKEAGLNIEQAGAFMGDMLKYGEPGRQVVTGMSTAMKEFTKEGLDFKDGMKLTAETLNQLGDTEEGQALAEKLFGTRNWVVAKDAVAQYMEVVEQGPDAFSASADSVSQFIDDTETLGNKFEEFKHKAEDAFKPLGDAAQGFAKEGLNAVSTWFTSHEQEILGDIKSWGDKLIDEIPTIQKFAEDGLRIFGDFGQVVLAGLAPITLALGTAGAGALALTGHFSDAKDLLEAAAKIPAVPIADMANTMADKIAAMHIDTSGIREDFDAALNSAMQMPTGIGNAIGNQSNAFATNGPGSATPGVFPSPVGAPPGGAPAGPGGPLGAFAPTAAGAHHADWDAIAQKESSGNWADHDSGHNGHYGGLQFLPATWTMYGGGEFAPGADQATKEQQITVAERILNGWNGIPGQGPGAWPDTYVGFSKGGSPSNAPGRAVTSGSGNGDDVPALLGRGEYVWDTDTVDKYGWLISALHNGSLKGFDQGGPTDGLDTKGAQVDTIAVAEAAKKLFGITDIGMYRSADGYNEHASGEAADVMVGNNKDTGDAVAQYFLQNAAQFGVQYVLWQQTQWNPDGSKSKMEDRGSPTANHMDHVHVRTLGGGFPQGADQSGFASPSTGQTSNTPSPIAMGLTGGAGSTPAGKNGGAFPGLPGQYGGNGVYGGETADQVYSTAKAVQDAQDRASDMDTEISKQARAIQDIKDELAKGDPNAHKPGLLPGTTYAETPAEQQAWADKQKKLNEQLSDATTTLARTQRERSEQDGVISEAQRKQIEAQYKKPTGAKGGNKDAQSLGSGLLEGIGQELGFGDVFGKSPLDWGIVKLAEGLFNYGNNLGDAIFGKTDSGGGMFGATPGGGQGLGADLGTGVLGSLGIKLPDASAISAAPNVIPAPPGSPLSGAGTGPLPGPPVINNDNSIHVSSDVSDTKVLGPVQEQQNSSNGHSFQYSGGFPAP
jgi:hypothetical protein